MILKLAIIFILLDAIYLFSTRNFTKKVIKNIQNQDLVIQVFPSILCYIFLLSAIYYFIILKQASLKEAFLLGIFIYGVFETTNLAIFKKWSPLLAIIDTLWGGILFTLTTYFYRLK